MLSRLTLILVLATPALATAETSWTHTGKNGVTVDGTRDCARADGTRTCNGTRLYTGTEGRTWEGTRTRVATKEGVSVTGDNSRRTWNWSRDRNR